jgi:sulfur carrier protein
VKLTLNGEARELPQGTTVAGLLEMLRANAGPVAVEVNLKVVPKKDHGTTLLREGDKVEVVSFVGGG